MWDLIYSSNPLDLAPSHRSKRERGDDTISGYGRGEERGRKRDSGGDISPSFRLFEPPTFLVASPLPIPPPEPTVIYDSFSPSSAVIGSHESSRLRYTTSRGEICARGSNLANERFPYFLHELRLCRRRRHVAPDFLRNFANFGGGERGSFRGNC